MKKVVPVVAYIRGQREVVGEAVVDMEHYDYPPGTQVEINLNNAGLSIRKD